MGHTDPMTSPPLPAPSAAVPSPRLSAWRRFVVRAGTLYLALYFLIGGQPLLGSGFEAQRVAAAAWLHGLLFGRPLASRRDPSPTFLRRLEDGLRVVLIFWLTMYALSKFSFGQFGLLHPGQLLTTYGESSPMGLLWRFMAASPGYQYVAGVAELLPALLLLHRRTVTLGALVAAVTMTNVLALNLFYDVPVKLFSSHLLLAALVLLSLDCRRLWAFVTGRAFAARPAAPPSRWEAPTAWVVTVLLIGGAVASGLSGLPRLEEARQEAAQGGELLRTRGFHWVNERPFNR